MTLLLTVVHYHATLFAELTFNHEGTGMKQFNVNIKEIRGRIGWSQEDLAREIGVSLSTVQRWEQLGTRPSRLARREIERFLHKVALVEK